ncbi:NAD dependent epimerase/dehydratase family protein-like protein [Kockiozyma suomiensis]|uniref:NAD dependent epimerase/dehydratase family protein-like protein n=1 Tax=Kockiozyma suomiensis TaxID=1337062 RepID=UPI003344088D
MASLAAVGVTGLVGSFFISLARNATLPPDITHVVAISRKPVTANLSTGSNKVTNSVTPELISAIPSDVKVFFSSLGTTKATAGSFEKQYAVDYTYNLELAKAAKAAGVSTYILISSGGAAADSYFAYPRMKGELERDVSALNFDRTIIIRPGLIVGDRSDRRPAEAIAQSIYKGIRAIPGIGGSAVKSIGIPAEDIAKAALVLLNKGGKGASIHGNTELIKLAEEFK